MTTVFGISWGPCGARLLSAAVLVGCVGWSPPTFAQQQQLDYTALKEEAQRLQALSSADRRVSKDILSKTVRLEIHRRGEANPSLYVERDDGIEFTCRKGLYGDFESGWVTARVEKFEAGPTRGGHFELTDCVPE